MRTVVLVAMLVVVACKSKGNTSEDKTGSAALQQPVDTGLSGGKGVGQARRGEGSSTAPDGSAASPGPEVAKPKVEGTGSDAIKTESGNPTASEKLQAGTRPAEKGSGSPASAPVAEQVVVARIEAFDATSLTDKLVGEKLSAELLTGIRTCYAQALDRDPTMRGKVILSLTVNETGRTVGAKSRGVEAALDTCFDGAMRTWRFPIPKDRDGQVTEASFSVRLTLHPK